MSRPGPKIPPLSLSDAQRAAFTMSELDVEEVGASTRNATAKVTKISAGAQRTAAATQAGPAGDDPWARQEPPF